MTGCGVRMESNYVRRRHQGGTQGPGSFETIELWEPAAVDPYRFY